MTLFTKIIEYAPPLLDSATTKRAPEIARVIGEAYYRIHKYKEAIPYLELFMEKSNIITREDYYKIAYSYYQAKEYKSAAKKFSSIANATDLLAQNSYYHLADCYLKLDKKEKVLEAKGSQEKEDIISALMNLGFKRKEVVRIVDETIKTLTLEAGFEKLLKESLKRMAKI